MVDLTNKSVKTRALDADLLKAIAIVAVVFIHGALLLPASVAFISWVFLGMRFCVPVFIFLWAYFTERSFVKSVDKKDYLLKRFRGLLIPFVFWSVVYFFIIADFKNLTFSKFVTSHWIGSGWAGQYYFIILFQLIAVFYLIHLLAYKFDNYLAAIILLSLGFYITITYSSLFSIGIVNKIGERPFFYWLPYVFIGVIYARKSVASYLVLPLPVIAVAPFLVPLEVIILHPSTALQAPYLLPSTFISSLLIIHSLMGKNLSFVMNWNGFLKVVGLLSRNTLGLFCLNPLIILAVSYLLQYIHVDFRFPGHYIINPIVSTVGIIVACLMLISMLKRLNLGRLVTN